MVIYIQGIFRQIVFALGQGDIGIKDVIKYPYVMAQKIFRHELKATIMN